jgi:hypothetical protein
MLRILAQSEGFKARYDDAKLEISLVVRLGGSVDHFIRWSVDECCVLIDLDGNFLVESDGGGNPIGLGDL